MKRVIVRRVGVSSVAKYVGIVQGVLGLVYGIFALFAGFAAVLGEDSFDHAQKVGLSVAVVFGALVVLPVVTFVIGWIYGAVASIIINFFLDTSRGIEIDIEEEKK